MMTSQVFGLPQSYTESGRSSGGMAAKNASRSMRGVTAARNRYAPCDAVNAHSPARLLLASLR
jgi:hypothetical protein